MKICKNMFHAIIFSYTCGACDPAQPLISEQKLVDALGISVLADHPMDFIIKPGILGVYKVIEGNSGRGVTPDTLTFVACCLSCEQRWCLKLAQQGV